MNIRVFIVLSVLLSALFIALSDQRLSWFKSFALFGVNDNYIREYFGEFLGIEKLGSLLLISCVIDVKGFSIVLKNLFEFTYVTWHVKGRWIHEQDGLTGFAIGIFKLSAELFEVWIESKLHIECSLEALIKDILSEFLSLDSSSSRK